MADTPEDTSTLDSRSALDNLFKEVTATEAPEPGDATPEGDKPAEGTPAPTPDPAPKPADKPADAPADPPAPKPDDKPADQPEPKPAPPVDPDAFDKVELPPLTRPKTGEAFEKVKTLARETISAQNAKIEDLQKQLADRDQKLKGVLPPEATKELEELRTFRRSVDVENDPEFRSKFDGKIEANNNAILAKLAEIGMPPEKIEEMKKLGGPDAEVINWEGILAKLSPGTRRYIEGKLGANEDLRQDRKTEIEKTRKDPSVFEKQQVESRAKAIVDSANSYLVKLPWTAERAIPANAKPEEKAKIEADNAFAKEVQGMLGEDLKQFTPEKFGEMAVGTAMAFQFRRELIAKTAEAKATTENLAKVTTERDTLKAELDKIKKAGQTHRRTSTTPPPAVVNPITEPGRIALDRLRDEIS